jgi:signal transduction histidine kinase
MRRRVREKRLRQTLADSQQALRMRTDVLSMVSHDLRNELTALLLSITSLEAEASADDRRRDRSRIEAIRRAAMRMNRMTSDLLDLTSIEAGHLALDRCEIAASELVTEALTTWRDAVAHKGLRFDVLDAVGPLRVSCDRERVAQIFANLISNALKFTAVGAVRLIAERDGESVRFGVADTGPGIPSAEQRRLFDAHFSGEDGVRRGHGLGLYIAKGLVEGLGGQLSVESRPGLGSTFYFTLPMTLQPQPVFHA